MYRTQGNKLICSRIGRTIWDGERDRHEAQAVADESGVVEFFGMARVAKQLYATAGIAASEQID